MFSLQGEWIETEIKKFYLVYINSVPYQPGHGIYICMALHSAVNGIGLFVPSLPWRSLAHSLFTIA